MDSQGANHHIMSDLIASLQKQEEFVVFRPNLGEGGWGSITSHVFLADLKSSAKYYRNALTPLVDASHEESSPTIVGVWLSGQKYSDTVTILGLSLAGFIPQLFSTVFQNPNVLWDLMARSGARALVYDVAFEGDTSTCSIPSLRVPAAFPETDENTKPPNTSYTDVLLIVHSSGTTGGMPKIIPVNHGWMLNFITVKFPGAIMQGEYDKNNVMNTLGNLAHVGSLSAFMAAAYHGFCTVQSSSMNAPTSELLKMITVCGVNRLALYATFLSAHIKEARTTPSVADILKSCRQILHTGVSLHRDDEEWAVENGLPVTTMYGCTETAPVMTSVLGSEQSARLLRLIPGVEAASLVPCEMPVASSGETTALFEMVCYSGKIDSPHSSLFQAADGLFHTDDVFELVQPGLYKFKGRKGDWIKTLNGFCDAQGIEENVRSVCKDLIHDAAVVGENRPLPCLFIELPQDISPGPGDAELITEILSRTRSYNTRLFPYERIEDPHRIIILPHGSIPRTKEKGNIRRSAIATLFADRLDQIFGGQ